MPFELINDVTVTVANSTELSEQIHTLAAQGGGTIKVAASEVPYLLRGQFGAADAPIRIISEDPDAPALFFGVTLEGSQNLSFEGLLFDCAKAAPGGNIMSLKVTHSTGISFSNNAFISEGNGFWDGVADLQIGDSLGKIRSSEDFTFENNSITGYFQGLSLNNVTGSTIAGNSFTQMQADGLRLTGVVDMLIENNRFADFHGSVHAANHDDMIQMWSTPASQVSENLTIRGNILDSGMGSATQSIFIRNEYQAQGGDAYRNIVIEDNIVYNGHSHGITVDGTDGVTIANNTLIWNQNATMQSTAESQGVSSAPRINVTNSSTVTVTDNVTPGLSFSAVQGEQAANNVTLVYGDPLHETSVEQLLVNASEGGKLSLLDLAIRPDSSAAGTAGSSLSRFPESVSELTPLISQAEMIGQAQSVTYDASLTLDAAGLVGAEGASYRWDFSDGTVKTGAIVSHAYHSSGDHTVTLTVTSAAGETASTNTISHVASDLLLALDFDAGIADASSYGSALGVIAPADAVAGVTGAGFALDGKSRLEVAEQNGQLEKLPSFTIALSLACEDVQAGAGSILSRYGSFDLGLAPDGALVVSMVTADGRFSLATPPSVLGDADWHRIAVSYDSAAETLALHYDGRMIASTEATGIFSPRADQPFYLGGATWVSSAKASIDDLTITRSAWDGATVKADYRPLAEQKEGDILEALENGQDVILHDIQFDSDAYQLRSYQTGYRQDYGHAEITEDGLGATLRHNAWKMVDLDLAVTEDLKLSFTFEAEQLGEIHGIGFVSADGTIDPHAVFQLAGLQQWGLVDQAWAYELGTGAMQYEIAVGQHLAGSYVGLALVMDDDAHHGGTASFSNVTLWREGVDLPLISNADAQEPEIVLYDIDFAATPLISYQPGWAQDFGTAILAEEGQSATLVENAWKIVDKMIEIDSNSVLRFSFEAPVEGEIHGIGFVNARGRVEAEHVFQLAGSQDWGRQDAAWTHEIGSGPIQYEIAVGDYFTGRFEGLALVMDDDAGLGGISRFSDVEIALDLADEFLLHQVDFNDAATQPKAYAGRYAQDFGQIALSEDGRRATLTENSWKVIDLDVAIEATTVLSVAFSAEQEGEIHGIGFVDGAGNVASEDVFQFAGTQDWGHQDEAWAYEIGSGEAQIEIAVGQYLRGDYSGIALIMDDDMMVGADSSFADIEIF